MEVAEIAIELRELLERQVYFAPIHYRFTWDKVICLIPEEKYFSDLEKYWAKGARTVYVSADHLPKIHELGLSYSGMKYGPELLMPAYQRRLCFQLLEEAQVRLQKVGVRSPRQPQMRAELMAQIYLLSTNPLLSESLMELLKVSPSLFRHSVEVAYLSQLLYESTVAEPSSDFEAILLLMGLLHDLGKVHLPEDLREKNRSQLTRKEQMIFNSYSQNLSLLVERDPLIQEDLREVVIDYDLLERGEVFKPYELAYKAWLVIIANRLAEEVLPESQFASMGRFKQALLRVEAEGLGLPLEVVEAFKRHVEGRWKLVA